MNVTFLTTRTGRSVSKQSRILNLSLDVLIWIEGVAHLKVLTTN
jgi:hypothetical protein